PRAVELVDPPISTENTTTPCGFSLATNERISESPGAGTAPSDPPPATGKFGFVVVPAMYAFPALSTAIAAIWSLAALSKYDKYRYPLILGSTLAIAKPMVCAAGSVTAVPAT